jgi:acetyltransferase-like isoleucine patch superfamily enzyme
VNYTGSELEQVGIRVGANSSIHKSVLFFNPDKIVIGHHVRIDCFSVLSAGEEGIMIGRNVHVAASSLVFGAGGQVVLSDFSALSARVTLFTTTDDYSEGYLTNPTVPERYKKVRRGPIVLERHALIGAASVVLPGVTLARGCTVGAMSLVHQNVGEYEVVFGIPFRVIGRRDPNKLQELENAYLQGEGRVG